MITMNKSIFLKQQQQKRAKKVILGINYEKSLKFFGAASLNFHKQ